MDNTQKLFSDAERAKKHYRAEHSGSYDGVQVSRQIVQMFSSNNKNLFDLAESFADYWFNTYISQSKDIENEPTADSLNKLAAFQSVLDNDMAETGALSQEDWQELCNCTKELAEELPIDTLNDLMAMFLEKQAF